MEIITSFFGIAFLIMFLTIFVLTIFVWIFSVIICQENQRKRRNDVAGVGSVIQNNDFVRLEKENSKTYLVMLLGWQFHCLWNETGSIPVRGAEAAMAGSIPARFKDRRPDFGQRPIRDQ